MSPSSEARMELDRAKVRRESRERDREFSPHECSFFQRHWWIGLALWLVYGLYLMVTR